VRQRIPLEEPIKEFLTQVFGLVRAELTAAQEGIKRVPIGGAQVSQRGLSWIQERGGDAACAEAKWEPKRNPGARSVNHVGRLRLKSIGAKCQVAPGHGRRFGFAQGD
jgi:hypothetical protein